MVQGPGPVKYCLCDQDRCNYVQQRALDNLKREQRALDSFPSTPDLSMRSQDFIFPFDNSSRVLRARGGRERRLQCYTCGSLFNRESPACAAFDPADPAQLTTCNEGEACMLYTWRKSRTEIGTGRCKK